VLGEGLGLRVETEREMADALARARANKDAYTLIQVMLPKDDHSPALHRLTASLKERVHKDKG
jgi:indolepyruvate decarboxylase